MRLFATELRKLIFNPRSIIILAVFIIICGLIGAGKGYMSIGGIKNFNIYKDLAKPYEGKPVDGVQAEKSKQAADEVLKIIGDSKEAINNEKASNPIFRFNYDYMKFAETSDRYLNGSSKDLPDKPTGINKMETFLKKLEAEGKKDTFSYKGVSKHLKVEKSMGVPLFYSTLLWENFLNTIGGFINLILLLIPIGIIIAPVFSREAASGMDNIILSSRYGRKKIVTAKVCAVALASAVWITAYFFVFFLTNFLPMGSFYGASAPIRSLLALSGAPYQMTILQYAFLIYAWLMFAGLARKILDELPFVREKLIDFEIIPLGPFSYFEMLFRDYKPPQQG